MPGGKPDGLAVLILAVGVIVADEPFQRFDGEPVVPLEVQQFVLERINSIAQLEALIMMRNAPDTWWASSSLAERLYISEPACRAELEGLQAQRLVLSRQEDIGWRFVIRRRPGNCANSSTAWSITMPSISS